MQNISTNKDVKAIEISDLWFAYDAEPVLRGASLVVNPGDRACLIGPNGGGKTTLLKLILGLLEAQRGSINIFGHPASDASKMIGYGPQHAAFDFHFPVSVMDVVRMGSLGMPRREAQKTTELALKVTGLTELAGRTMQQLSGGQRQRVLIARALACKPRLLLLDEPTANLDMGAEQEFYDMLMALDEAITILIVSHDIGFVSKLTDKVICLNGDMAVHPTSQLSGELMHQLYGHDVRLVRHDHDCRLHPDGHCNANSNMETRQ